MNGFTYLGNTMFWPVFYLSFEDYKEALDDERQRLLWVLLQGSIKKAERQKAHQTCLESVLFE